MRRLTEVTEFLQGEVASENPQSTLRSRDQPLRVNVFERGFEPFPDFLHRLHPATRDRHHSKDDRGGLVALQQLEIVVAMRVFQ